MYLGASTVGSDCVDAALQTSMSMTDARWLNGELIGDLAGDWLGSVTLRRIVSA